MSKPGGRLGPGSYQRGGTDRVILLLRVFRAIIFRQNEFISFCFNYFHMYFQTVDGSPVVGSSLRHFGTGTGLVGLSVLFHPSALLAFVTAGCTIDNTPAATSSTLVILPSIRHSMRLVSLPRWMYLNLTAGPVQV